MKRLFMVILVVVLGLSFVSCSKSSKLDSIAKDKGISDKEAVTKMVTTIWENVLPSHRKIIVKKSEGKLFVGVQIRAYSGTTTLKAENFKRINLVLMAKNMWRMLRYGVKRDIDTIMVEYIFPLPGNPNFVLFLVSLDMDQLKTVEGWNTLDPFDTNEYDVLEGDSAKVPVEIMKVWKMKKDNFSQVVFH